MEQDRATKSPSVAFVGRHNSGKTTLVVKVISRLVEMGFDVGSVKHHGHVGFEVDVPGKDSWRHRQAGACEVVVCSPDRLALMRELDEEIEAGEAIGMMRAHDVVVVEGYRSCGLPSVEVMRSGNERDALAAEAFADAVEAGTPFVYDEMRLGRDAGRMPDEGTIAVATDIPRAAAAARACGIGAFGLDDDAAIAEFIVKRVIEPGQRGSM